MAGRDQGGERKRTTDEVSKQMRWRQNRGASLTPGSVQGDPAYCLDGVRHKGGATLIQALAWDLGTCRLDGKGETQVEDPQG
jgi:hypothetical protein